MRVRNGNSITGRVLTDAGVSVSGAAVYLTQTGTAKVVLAFTTDDDGRFIADDLSDATYNVTVSAPGYVQPSPQSGFRRATEYRPGDSITITLVKGGVITGRVVDARGKPVPALGVRPTRVRDLDGKPAYGMMTSVARYTDDRGIYRLYGLEPGVYIVAAGGVVQPNRQIDPHWREAPTFYQSGTRDTAVEVRVEPGMEVTGADIGYRGDGGYAVSGTVGRLEGREPGSIILTTLNYANSSTPYSSSLVTNASDNRGFAFYGVADGEYELVAYESSSSSKNTAYASRHIVVRGGDVSGLNLSLTPLGSIAGRVLFEPTRDLNQNCSMRGGRATPSVSLSATRDETGRLKDPQNFIFLNQSRAQSDRLSEFVLYNLMGGLYRLETALPAKDLYVKSVTFRPIPHDRTASKLMDAGREGLRLKQGEQVNGVTVTVTDGAASLQGRVITKGSSTALIRIHLVPAEGEAADEVLRYAEVSVAADGTFELKNIAPGRYWVLAKDRQGGDSTYARPAAWDVKGRAALRRDALASNVSIDLRPCQQKAEYVLTTEF
jgi:hypothetical protein